jgi:hypothetical protein
LNTPYLRVEETGAVIQLTGEVTTVGRGQSADVRLDDPSVSRLHAELVRRGPYVYVADLGLSRTGTRVNGRPVGRRVLDDGDVLTFGSARCRIGGLVVEEQFPAAEPRRPAAVPELTRRELDVLVALCKPALSDEAFVLPSTAREIADDLVVTEAAIKQHLLRLYQKLHIPEGPNRRTRLANQVIALGLVRPFVPPSPDIHWPPGNDNAPTLRDMRPVNVRDDVAGLGQQPVLGAAERMTDRRHMRQHAGGERPVQRRL